MKNIIAVTFANLRKSKSQAISLLVFALIAAMLLNVGLLLMMRYGDFFDQKSEELHAPHYVLVESKALYSKSQVDYLKNYPGVIEVETEPALAFEQTDLPYSGGSFLANVVFINVETKRAMNDLTLIEGGAPKAADDICLPYLFKVGGGYEIGDRYTIDIDGSDFTFEICGFSEEIAFGASNFTTYQMYLSNSGYESLLDKKPGLECVILRARMDDPEQSDKLLVDCTKKFFTETDVPDAHSMFFVSISRNTMLLSRTTMSGVTSIITMVFAIMIVLISLLMIRFRIQNSIEESMMNIGALKAVGYTGTQLLWATILQFGTVVIVGSLAGIGVSYAALPLVSRILEAQSALRWSQGFDMTTNLISLFITVSMTLLVTWLSARRIRKLQPLTALRQGLVTHSFKRNHFSLDCSRGPLSLLLALKSSLQSKGQMIMIFIIVTAISFMAVAGVSVYDNIGLHPETFGKIISGEVPDAAIAVRDPDDAKALYDYIEKNDNVRKIVYYDGLVMIVSDTEIVNIVVDDFSLLEGSMLYEGRYPKHNNEVVVTNKLAQQVGSGIGETIKIIQAGKSAEYLIVGMIQSMNNGGYSCAMTITGMQRIQPDYRPGFVYVYLNDNTKTNDLIKAVEKEFGELLAVSTNIEELMDTQLGVYGVIFSAVAFAIVGVTVLVIIMVLYLMLKTVILRRRRELGIQKALGFTTLQLMNQFALNFIPAVALGVAAGGVAGVLGFNSFFLMTVRGMGIMTASMPAPIGMTIVLCIGLVLIAYFFAMLIAWRIRKVSAYALVSE